MNWIQEEVKETKEFKNALKKQKELDKEREKASKFSWSDIVADPTIITGLTVTAGVTVWQIISGGYKDFVFG